MDRKIIVLNDDECDTKKPDTEKKCQLRPCEGVDWVTSAWSGVRKQIIFRIFYLYINVNLIFYYSNLVW